MAFSAQLIQSQLRKVQGTQSMVETGVIRPWINEMAHAELLDAAQALKVAVLDKIVDDFVADSNKSVHWVVEYLSFVDGRLQEDD